MRSIIVHNDADEIDDKVNPLKSVVTKIFSHISTILCIHTFIYSKMYMIGIKTSISTLANIQLATLVISEGIYYIVFIGIVCSGLQKKVIVISFEFLSHMQFMGFIKKQSYNYRKIEVLISLVRDFVISFLQIMLLKAAFDTRDNYTKSEKILVIFKFLIFFITTILDLLQINNVSISIPKLNYFYSVLKNLLE